MQNQPKNYFLAARLLLILLLLVGVSFPVSAQFKLKGRNIKVKKAPSRPTTYQPPTPKAPAHTTKALQGASRIGKTAPIKPENIQRLFQSKLYRLNSDLGISKQATWFNATAGASFPVFKNKKALFGRLEIYTAIKLHDRVVHLRPFDGHQEADYYVYELPQTLRYFSNWGINILSPEKWVLIHRTDGMGKVQIIQKSAETRNANPLRKPLPEDLPRRLQSNLSPLGLWCAISGKNHIPTYKTLPDLQGDLAAFFSIAPDWMKGTPLGKAKLEYVHRGYDIYMLPVSEVTLNDITYTRKNSLVLVEELFLDYPTPWDSNRPAVTILKRDEVDALREVTWFSK